MENNEIASHDSSTKLAETTISRMSYPLLRFMPSHVLNDSEEALPRSHTVPRTLHTPLLTTWQALEWQFCPTPVSWLTGIRYECMDAKPIQALNGFFQRPRAFLPHPDEQSPETQTLDTKCGEPGH